ncbi:hypothetical protein FQA39_LY17573 [Lamprigera yunnana]|nr:hypothetical protein FQA39_LY17573 [Lamprigera yunnana]
MSVLHLTEGSTRPENVPGKLRLYSMEYCPFAHRVRLVLLAKGVPHDVVNINLIKKPDWYFKVHPEGKVPALDVGNKVVVESLDISDYLNDEYPEPALYPAEPHARELDAKLIQQIGPLTQIFHDILMEPKKKSSKEWLEDFTPALSVFEIELDQRKTTFFGGDKPGMVDFMLWPWAERAESISLALGEKLLFGSNDFPKLCAWSKTMRKNSIVESIYHGPEKYYKIVLAKKNNDANACDTI